MKHLKFFESSQCREFDFNEDDIKDIFTDFEDEGFLVSVRFGKRLHQFDEIDSKIKDQELKFGFVPSIWIYLHSNEVDAFRFQFTKKYLNLIENVKFRLSCKNLYIKDVDILPGNQMMILIYTK